MQALGPEAGQAFLDIGSGTGYLTMVAANLVGHTGKAVGLEVTLWHNNPISLTAVACHQATVRSQGSCRLLYGLSGVCLINRTECH